MQAALADKPGKQSKPVQPAPEPVSQEVSQDLVTAAGVPPFLQRAVGDAGLADIEEKIAEPLERLDRAPLLQTKLAVSQPDDEHEREADQVADRVMRKSVAQSPPVELTSIDEMVQPKASGGAPGRGPQAASTSPSSDSGVPMAPAVRKRVEPALGADLTKVRVHTDDAARGAARTLNARAFTHRNHIWLGANQSPEDVSLMAHEATHVVQQSKPKRSTATHAAGGPPAVQRQEMDAGAQTVANEPDAEDAGAVGELLPDVVEVEEDLGGLEELQAPTADPTRTESARSEEVGSAAEDAGAEPETDPEEVEPEAQSRAEEATAEAEAGAEGGAAEGGGEGGAGEEPGAEGAEGEGGAGAGGGGAAGAPAAAAAGAAAEVLDTLGTGEIALIDEELAEHQRWGAATERVGTAESLERAEFIAEAAGGGMLGGLGSGAAMGVGMGLVGRAAARFIPVPGVGGILSGAMSVYGLASRDWSATGETISQFGEGASTYDTLANSLAAIAEIVDVVSNILGVVEGVVGVIQIGVYAVTAAAGVATVLTLGAAAPLLASMATLAETLTVISLALGVVTTALDLINAGILQPAVLLFRALHAFTSEADPREIEAQGGELSQAAGAIGGALGAAAGARGAAAGSGRPRGGDTDAPNSRPQADPPASAAAGDGPTVRYEAPTARSAEAPAGAAGGRTESAAAATPATTPSPAATATPGATPSPAATTAPAPAAPAAPGRPAATAAEAPAAAAGARPSAAGAEASAARGGGGEGSGGGARPSEAGEGPELTGMRVETIGEGTMPDITDADIDAFVGGIETNARSDTFFELPGQNPRTGGGLQPVRPRGETPALAPDGTPLPAGAGESAPGATRTTTSDNPDRIAYHENMYFRDVGEIRIADAADVPVGGARAPGESVIPEGVGSTADAVPRTRIGTGPGVPDTANVEVRYHSQNPRAPEGSYSAEHPTVQINTPARNFPWAPTGGRVRGQTGRYMLPDGTWVTMGGATDAQRAAAHWPVGGSGGGPGPGGGGAGGAPPTGGGPAPAPPPAAPAGAAGQLTLPNVDMTPTPPPARQTAAVGEQLELPLGPSGQLDLPFDAPAGAGAGPARRPARSRGRTEQSDFAEGVRERMQEMAESGIATNPRDAYTRELMYPEQIAELAETGRLPPAEESMRGAHQAHHPASRADWPERRLDSEEGISLPQREHMFGPDFHGRPSTADIPDWVEGVDQVLDTDVNRPTPSVDAQIRSQYRSQHPELFEAGGPLAPTIPLAPGQQGVLPGIDMRPTRPPTGGESAGGEQLSLPFNRGEQLELDFSGRNNPPEGSSGGGSPAGIPPPAAPAGAAPAPPATPPATAANRMVPQTPTSASVRAGQAAPEPSQQRPSSAATPSVSTMQSFSSANKATQMGLREEDEAQPAQAPGLATQVGQLFLPQLFSSGGETPTTEQRQAAHRGRFAEDAQAAGPGVERVNPDYPPPPGTPQQLDAIQQEIENLLAARARAEQAEEAMAGEERTLEGDRAPIQQALEGADGGISAVQAHQQAVTRRAQVNQEQQQRQQEAGGLVAGYPSRATGLATLTVPLAVFKGFTSLASHLPGDAGAAMADMHADATRIEAAFEQMAAEMAGQEEAQPAREEELSSQQASIEGTDAQATDTQQSVDASRQEAVTLQEDNETQLAAATSAREEAAQDGEELDQAAQAKQAQADTLAEQLQSWAQAHREARAQAVAATAAQLEAEGMVVVERNEG